MKPINYISILFCVVTLIFAWIATRYGGHWLSLTFTGALMTLVSVIVADSMDPVPQHKKCPRCKRKMVRVRVSKYSYEPMCLVCNAEELEELGYFD